MLFHVALPIVRRLGVPFGPVLSLAAPDAHRGRAPLLGPPRPGVVSRAVGAARDIYALARHAEARRPDRRGDPDVVEARLLASQWQTRAETAERRVQELERRLASSEMTALDLRARVVCLHGKLATSTATARYQVLTLALEGQAHPPGDRPVARARPS